MGTLLAITAAQDSGLFYVEDYLARHGHTVATTVESGAGG
jgi:hypothetical protein